MKKRATGVVANALIRAKRAPEYKGKWAEDVVAVLSPASHGSLGDEALVLGSTAVNDEHNLETLVLSPGESAAWARAGVSAVSLDASSKFGSFLWGDDWLNGRQRPRTLVVLGADSVDGVYGLRSLSQRVGLLNDHAARGGRSFLANFSFRSDPSQESVSLLKCLRSDVALVARDVNSQARAAAALRREVGIAPDVAQHLRPDATPAVLGLGVDIQRQSQGRKVIGVVPNAHFGSLYGDRSGVLQGFTDLVVDLRGRGFACVVIAHDIRTDPGDPALVRDIVAASGEEHVYDFVPETAAEAKAMIATTDLLVTGRMHAAVAALSQGVPCIGLDYVDKFAGQFDWWNARVDAVPRDLLKRTDILADRVVGRLQETTNEPRSALLERAVAVQTLTPGWL